jgi:hypothetical protein
VIETGPLPAILEAPRTAAFWNACIIDRKGTGRPRHAAVQAIGLQHGYGARTVIAGVDLDRAPVKSSGWSALRVKANRHCCALSWVSNTRSMGKS